MSNWGNISKNGSVDWGKFWAYGGLGAANGAGAASGNIWIIAATGALQGAGNKFTERNFKFDTDQIWKEGLYFGATSVVTSYLMLPNKVSSAMPLGSKGLGLGDQIAKGLGKMGITGNTGKYLSKGIADFSTSLATQSGYYGFVADSKSRENWFNKALRVSAISTFAQLGLKYSLDNISTLLICTNLRQMRLDTNMYKTINRFYLDPFKTVPPSHHRFIDYPILSPEIPPTNIFDIKTPKRGG